MTSNTKILLLSAGVAALAGINLAFYLDNSAWYSFTAFVFSATVALGLFITWLKMSPERY